MAGEQPIKFGILGCASIARKISRAISLSPNCVVAAVGSRSYEKASKFAKENGFPTSARVYGSYDAVLDDPEVDAVYVPLPTRLHVKWAVLAAQKKKHLLLEKPVALSIEELDIILQACESSQVQFMDATMWMHHPRTEEMKKFLSNSYLFGDLKFIHSCLTFAAGQDFLENDIRVKPDLDALGALGDVGWYCIRSILWAVDFQLPKFVLALPGPIFNKAGVILECGGSLHWEDGKVATFHCSFFTDTVMDVNVVGTNGTLHVHDFVIPFQEDKCSFTTSSKSGFTELATGWEPKPREHVVMTDLPQEALMVREFSRLVEILKLEGSKPDKLWPVLSRKTQLVMDAIKISIERDFKRIEVMC